jgi:uncharacterized membrane protein (Fun14 family)
MSAANSLVLPGLQFGGGGLVGFVIGYGLKKLAKLLMIIVGVLAGVGVLFLGVLSYLGIITINYAALVP